MRIWRRFRGWSTRAQVVTWVVAGLIATAALSSDPEDPGTSVATKTAGSDVADDLPFAETTRPTTQTTTTVAAVPATTTTLAATTTAPPTTAAPVTTVTDAPPPPARVRQAPANDCHPSYDPCVPYASDVDCAGGSGDGPAYTGRVNVIGYDEYELDRDRNGVGCESS